MKTIWLIFNDSNTKKKKNHDFHSFAQTRTLAPSITHAQLVFKYIYTQGLPTGHGATKCPESSYINHVKTMPHQHGL